MQRLGFWILAVALFTLMIWAPLVFIGWPTATTDHWLLFPQIRFLLYAAPSLVERWPGPLGVTISDEHRKMVAMAYGLFGLLAGHFAYKLNDWWVPRMVWLLFCWAIWIGALFVLGGIMSVGK